MFYKFLDVMNVSEVAFDIFVSEAAIVGFCHQTPASFCLIRHSTHRLSSL